MKKSNYSNQTYHYIPNEKSYYLEFPLSVLKEYNGADNLDATIDDNLLFYIFNEIINQKIEYKYELDLSDKSLVIQIKVNDKRFNFKTIVECLSENKMINGLKIDVLNYGKLKMIYEYRK